MSIRPLLSSASAGQPLSAPLPKGKPQALASLKKKAVTVFAEIVGSQHEGLIRTYIGQPGKFFRPKIMTPQKLYDLATSPQQRENLQIAYTQMRDERNEILALYKNPKIKEMEQHRVWASELHIPTLLKAMSFSKRKVFLNQLDKLWEKILTSPKISPENISEALENLLKNSPSIDMTHEDIKKNLFECYQFLCTAIPEDDERLVERLSPEEFVEAAIEYIKEILDISYFSPHITLFRKALENPEVFATPKIPFKVLALVQDFPNKILELQKLWKVLHEKFQESSSSNAPTSISHSFSSSSSAPGAPSFDPHSAFFSSSSSGASSSHKRKATDPIPGKSPITKRPKSNTDSPMEPESP